MASDNFANCLPFTLQYEGPWSDNPRDPGGATMWGVTQRVYDAYRKRNGKPLQTVRLISNAERADIYKSEYWDAIGGDMLPKGVDLMGFEIAVNNGVGRAADWLAQTAGLSPPDRINALHALRMGFWRGLKIWTYFGRGWTARETACLALAKRMAVQ